MSHPVAVSSAICWRVELTSDVRVVVIDCTETGESLPTPTFPTLIWRVLRRGLSTGGGASGMPRLISVIPLRLLTLPRRDVIGVALGAAPPRPARARALAGCRPAPHGARRWTRRSPRDGSRSHRG